MMIRALAIAFLVVIVSCGLSFAAHPLITDDTGTQGKGRFELEIAYEFEHEDNDGVEEDLHQTLFTVSYGIIDSMDLVVGIPVQHIRAKEAGVTSTEAGVADLVLEVKWRFFEKDNFSFAIKPNLSLPTGDDSRGLGSGEVGGGAFFIATAEFEPWTFHFNAGYGRAENTADEREDIWHVSLASEFGATQWLTLVANVGVEENSDRASDTPLAFIIGGAVFPITENVDLDLGLKGGLTDPESDFALLTGATFRF
jgi:hypothetical protein